MSTTLESQQTWTMTRIHTALVHINTALAFRRMRPDEPANKLTEQAIEEARGLRIFLEEKPSACTTDALDCCNRLLEQSGT